MPTFQYKRIESFDNTELFSSDNEQDYFPFHFHDFFCVSLITSGTEILKNTDQEFIAPAGTISITQLNEVHRNYSLGENGYCYKTIYVNPDVLRHFAGNKPVQALDRVIYNQPLFNNLLQLFNTAPANESELEKCFQSLASHATDPHPKNSWASVFYRIDEIIDAYPNKPIDTDWLAKKFCMSKFHFIREFKKAKGVTPQTYIMLYRLGQSKKLLLENVPFNDIAYTQGFYDPSHFTNSFKKYFGISPSRFVQP
ncbi:MAG: AraC family transcriptional regulator [Ferruginibacter sp.]